MEKVRDASSNTQQSGNLDPSTRNNIGMTTKPETYTISLKAEEPVYLWKWYVAAMTTESTYIVAKNNIYTQGD